MTAPVNDNFEDAIVLTGTSIAGTNVDATIESGENDYEGSIYATVWYKWTPSAEYGERASFSLASDGGFQGFEIYHGSTLESLTYLSNIYRDYYTGVVAGEDHYIRIYTFDNPGYTGTFTLTYDDPDVPPPLAPSNDLQTNATALTGTTISGDNTYAIVDSDSEYYDPYIDGFDSNGIEYNVWFTWTPAAGYVGDATFDTIGSSFDTVLSVWSGVPRIEAPQVAYDWDSGTGGASSVTFTPTPLQTYYIMLGGYTDGDFGAYVLNYPDPTAPLTGQFALAGLVVETSIVANLLKKPYPRASLSAEVFFPGSDAIGVNNVVGSTGTAALIAVTAKGEIGNMYVPSNYSPNQIRTLLKVTLDFSDPAIINGKPYSPDYWSNLEGVYSATANNVGTITVQPNPPIRPYTPGSDSNLDAYVWRAQDLQITSTLSKWPEAGGDGPSWISARGYQPSVRNRVTFGPKGKYHTQNKAVYFDYHNVEHMWLNMPESISTDFTWIFCGIILSYPTATYGHYVLDHGYNTPAVKPLPRTQASAKNLSESGYRAAMLYQPHSSLMGSHTGNDLARDGKHVRIDNNYVTSPRVMYSMWNAGPSNNKGKIGTIGKGYNKYKSGTIDNKTMKQFVMGRRFDRVSQSLASHMVIFEIRFFPRALGRTEMMKQYRNLSSKYKFGKYPS